MGVSALGAITMDASALDAVEVAKSLVFGDYDVGVGDGFHPFASYDWRASVFGHGFVL